MGRLLGKVTLPTLIIVWVSVPFYLISIIMSSKQMLSLQKYYFENENIYETLGFCHNEDILAPYLASYLLKFSYLLQFWFESGNLSN